MPTVAETARVTYKGAPPTGKDADTAQEKAWLVWTSVIEEAKRLGTKPEPGQNYLLWIGSLKAHVKRLWPEVEWEDQQKAQDFCMPIYYYLNFNKIMKTVRRNVPNTFSNEWAVSLSFEEGAIPKKPKKPRVEPTRTEQRLSAHEAGEDREPAPVEVTRSGQRIKASVRKADGTYACPVAGCGATFTSAYGIGPHNRAFHRRPDMKVWKPNTEPAHEAIRAKAFKHKSPKARAATAIQTGAGGAGASTAVAIPAPVVQVVEAAVQNLVEAIVKSIPADNGKVEALQAENAALREKIERIQKAFA